MERGRRALILTTVLLLGLPAARALAQAAEDPVVAATQIAEGKKDLDRAPSLENYDAAAAKFRQAVAAAPSYSAAHLYLGIARYLAGRQVLRDNDLDVQKANACFDEALTELARAAELAPLAGGPYLYTGLTHLAKSEEMRVDPATAATELAAAELALGKAIEVSAQNDRGPAYEGMGRVANRRGDPVRGMRYFDWALEVQPNSAWARYHRAQALMALGEYKRVDAECEALNKVISRYRLQRAYLDALDQKGRTSKDQAQETREVFREQYSGMPDFSASGMWPEVYKLQGQALHALNQFAAARSCYSQAMSPQHDGNTKSEELRTLQARELVAQASWAVRVEGRTADTRKLLKAADDKLTEVLTDTSNSYPVALEVRADAYLLEAEIYKSDAENKGKTLEDARDAYAKAIEAYVTARNSGAKQPESRSGTNFARCLASYGYTLAVLNDLPGAMAQFRRGLAEGDPRSWQCLVYQAYALSKSDGVRNRAQVRDLVVQVTEPDRGLAYHDFEALYTAARAMLASGAACRAQARVQGQTEGDLMKDGGTFIHDAIELADRASAVAPKDARPVLLAADAYFDLGQLASAERSYEKALALFSPARNVRVADQKAQVLYRLAYCNVVGLRPENAISYANLAVAAGDIVKWQAKEVAGDAYVQSRRLEAADAAYDLALQACPTDSPDQARILAKHGHALLLLGRVQDAELLILRAIAGFRANPLTDLTDPVRVERTRAAQEQANADLETIRGMLAK